MQRSWSSGLPSRRSTSGRFPCGISCWLVNMACLLDATFLCWCGMLLHYTSDTQKICAKSMPAGTLHSTSGMIDRDQAIVNLCNRWACGAGYNSKRTGQECYQALKARKLSRSQSDT